MDISKLALNPFLSDIKLAQVQNDKQQEYVTHKFVLVTQSEVFKKIIEDHNLVEKIVIPKSIKSTQKQDFIKAQGNLAQNEDHLGQILKLVYLSIQNPQQVREEVVNLVNKNNCFSYYSICQALGFNQIKTYFEEYIVSHISKDDDSLSLLFDSIQFQSEEMKQSALDIIVPKFSDFLRSTYLTNELINLPFEAFKALIQRDDICVNEESDVFNLVYKYILKRESDPEPPSEEQPQEQPQNPETNDGNDKPNPEEATEKKVEEAPKPEGEEAPKPEGEEAPKVEEEAPKEGEEAPKEEEAPKVEETAGDEEQKEKVEPPVEVDEKVYVMPDNLEEQAKQRLQNYKLTTEQKKELLLSLRLGYVSHESLLKYSNIDVLSEFKDIFLQAISSKLNYYDSQEFLNKYQFNLDPRSSYADRVNNLSAVYPNNTSKLNSNSISHKRNPSVSQQFPNNDKNIILNDTLKSENTQPTKGMKNSPNQGVKNFLQESNRGNNPNPYTLVDPKYQGQIQANNNSGISPFPGNSIVNIPSYNNFSQNMGQYQNHQQLPIHQSLYQPSNQSAIRPPQQGQYSGYDIPQGQNMMNNSNLRSPNRLPNQKQVNPEFVYKHDLDDNGALYYLGTQGKQKPYVNPHILGQVQAFASSVRAGKIEYFVGREVLNLSTSNERMSFMGVDLGEDRFLYPTAYTIRNRNSSTYVLLNWILEGSADGQHFIPIDKRIHFDPNDSHFNYTIERERENLKERGVATSYSIDENSLRRVLADHQTRGFRYFRIVQISKNSNGSENLSLSGFELYGSTFGNGWY